MTDRSLQRAADSDRDRVAEILRDAHGEGRLTQDELMERLDATYAARTYGELERLVADLPRGGRAVAPQLRTGPAVPGEARPARSRGRRIARAALTGAWRVYAFAVAINVMVWLFVSIGQGGPAYPWPVWVAGPWGLVLAFAEASYRSGERQ